MSTVTSPGAVTGTIRGDVRRRRSLRLPHHRGTTAHVCSLYPWAVQAGGGHHGVFIGRDLLAGGSAWVWDPFEAHAQGRVTNPNVWLMGEPGNGKSALVKTLLWRMRGCYGPDRFFAVVDPKGEYRRLADRLGLAVVRLRPGGSARVNPLEASGVGEVGGTSRSARQARTVIALAATVLRRPLAPVEEAALWEAVEHLSRRGPATLNDLVAVLAAPPEELAARLSKSDRDVAAVAEAVVFALSQLVTRSLRGMFDGPSTVTVDWSGPGVVLDLSAVYQDAEALPLVMVAATAWLQEALFATPRRKVQLLDEVWGLLGNRASAGYLQAAWKLGRQHGIANIGVAHRPSDLAGQADDGTAVAKIARGLLADSATVIVMRQAADELAAAKDMLGLNGPQVRHVRRLSPGQALWRTGSHVTVVKHQLGPGEWDLIDTDAAMRGEHEDGRS